MTPFKVVLTNVTQELYTLRQETVLVFGDRESPWSYLKLKLLIPKESVVTEINLHNLIVETFLFKGLCSYEVHECERKTDRKSFPDFAPESAVSSFISC